MGDTPVFRKVLRQPTQMRDEKHSFEKHLFFIDDTCEDESRCKLKPHVSPTSIRLNSGQQYDATSS
jgi:hypothetical protein